MKLISPFVGRILDWCKASTGKDYLGDDDPGVQSVRRIYQYYKQHGYPVEVMGASFRNIGQIQSLAGCDLLTISPALLAELKENTAPLPRRLEPGSDDTEEIARVRFDEASFRFALNEDAMATEKTAQGIRAFAADIVKLEELVREMAG